MTQLLYSDTIVAFLTEFAKTTDHRPEILLSFGFVPKVESRIGLINWLIQDPGNAAVADEQAFVKRLAASEPAGKRRLMVDLYKRVIDGVRDLGFPLSIHLEADLRRLWPGVCDLRGDARLLVTCPAGLARSATIRTGKGRGGGSPSRGAARGRVEPV